MDKVRLTIQPHLVMNTSSLNPTRLEMLLNVALITTLAAVTYLILTVFVR